VAAPLDRPYRGSGADRPVGVPFPPEAMPLRRAGTLLKRWHYVSFWSPTLIFCAAQVNVGLMAQEYWGVWDRAERRFWQRTNYVQRRDNSGPSVSLKPQRSRRQTSALRQKQISHRDEECPGGWPLKRRSTITRLLVFVNQS